MKTKEKWKEIHTRGNTYKLNIKSSKIEVFMFYTDTPGPNETNAVMSSKLHLYKPLLAKTLEDAKKEAEEILIENYLKQIDKLEKIVDELK